MEVTKPILLDETGQAIKDAVESIKVAVETIKTAVDNQSTNLQYAIDSQSANLKSAIGDLKTAIENHSGSSSGGAPEFTDRTTGKKYALYVNNGELMMEECK